MRCCASAVAIHCSGIGKVPGELTNRLGIAVGQSVYKAYRELLASPRFQRVANAGGRAQRLLWASTGTKDPKASDILYVKALAAPFTIDTMPDGTLRALPPHAAASQIDKLWDLCLDQLPDLVAAGHEFDGATGGPAAA